MKTKAFDYLKRAPKLPGHRILSPTAKARPGDRFIYLDLWV